MANKKKTETPVTNSNVNNSSQTVHVHFPKQEISSKSKPHWLTRVIVGGLITLALSLIGYYVKNTFFGKKYEPAAMPQSERIKGHKM